MDHLIIDVKELYRLGKKQQGFMETWTPSLSPRRSPNMHKVQIYLKKKIDSRESKTSNDNIENEDFTTGIKHGF